MSGGSCRQARPRWCTCGPRANSRSPYGNDPEFRSLRHREPSQVSGFRWCHVPYQLGDAMQVCGWIGQPRPQPLHSNLHALTGEGLQHVVERALFESGDGIAGIGDVVAARNTHAAIYDALRLVKAI